MDTDKLLSAIDKLKNPIQLGAFIIVALILFIINLGDTPIVVSTFIFAILPTVIFGTNFGTTEGLTKKQRFYVIMAMFFISTLFILLSVLMLFVLNFDRTHNYENEWSQTYEQKLMTLNNIIEPVTDQIDGLSKKEYEEFITRKIVEQTKNDKMCDMVDDRVEALIGFFTRVLECERRGNCRGSSVKAAFERPIHEFWYNFRGYIKNIRECSGFSSRFGYLIEDYAVRNQNR